jgi:hypothetical protein
MKALYVAHKQYQADIKVQFIVVASYYIDFIETNQASDVFV